MISYLLLQSNGSKTLIKAEAASILVVNSTTGKYQDNEMWQDSRKLMYSQCILLYTAEIPQIPKGLHTAQLHEIHLLRRRQCAHVYVRVYVSMHECLLHA